MISCRVEHLHRSAAVTKGGKSCTVHPMIKHSTAKLASNTSFAGDDSGRHQQTLIQKLQHGKASSHNGTQNPFSLRCCFSTTRFLSFPPLPSSCLIHAHLLLKSQGVCRLLTDWLSCCRSSSSTWLKSSEQLLTAAARIKPWPSVCA